MLILIKQSVLTAITHMMKSKTFNGAVEFIEVNIVNNKKCGGAVEIETKMQKDVKLRSTQLMMID